MKQVFRRTLALALMLAVLLTGFAVPAMAKTRAVRIKVSNVYVANSDSDFRKANKTPDGHVSLRVGQSITFEPDYAYEGAQQGWFAQAAGRGFRTVWKQGNSYAGMITATARGAMVQFGWKSQKTGATTNGYGLTIYSFDADAPDAQSVSILEGKTATLCVGDTAEFYARVMPDNAATAYRWTSSTPKVLAAQEADSVYTRTTVTAKAAGTAKLTVTTDNGKKATITVKVVDKNKPSAVSITNGKTVSLYPGDTVQLETAFTPAVASTSLTWKTSKKSVATVSKTGLVTALKKGTAKITVTTKNKKKATITVKVLKEPPDVGLRVAHPVFNTAYWTGNPTESQVYQAIVEMKSQYPEGKRWNNNDYYEWNAQGIFAGGYGCVAFACLLSDAAFGHLPYREHADVDAIRVGDVLSLDSGSHTVIVLKVSSKDITIAEGNFNNSIHWGRTIKKSKLKKSLDYVMTRYPG